MFLWLNLLNQDCELMQFTRQTILLLGHGDHCFCLWDGGDADGVDKCFNSFRIFFYTNMWAHNNWLYEIVLVWKQLRSYKCRIYLGGLSCWEPQSSDFHMKSSVFFTFSTNCAANVPVFSKHAASISGLRRSMLIKSTAKEVESSEPTTKPKLN